LEEKLATGGIVSGNTPAYLPNHCCCLLTEKQREELEHLLPAQTSQVTISVTVSGRSDATESRSFRDLVAKTHRICDLHGIRRVE
jgi:hypothetical protein